MNSRRAVPVDRFADRCRQGIDQAAFDAGGGHYAFAEARQPALADAADDDELPDAGAAAGGDDLLRQFDMRLGETLAVGLAGTAIVQDADAIWREEIDKLPMAQRPSQYFAALTNMRSVGVMGDERTYDYAIALRAVTTTDFMTAEVTILPTETITTAANRIVNEVKNINRVMFDYTTKPPATIEWE